MKYVLIAIALAAPLRSSAAGQPIDLRATSSTILLSVGRETYQFGRTALGGWVLEGVDVDHVRVAIPLSPTDSFLLGGGTASAVNVDRDDVAAKQVSFRLARGTVTYTVRADDRLAMAHVVMRDVQTPAVAWRTALSSADEHGAWATRGETATDAEAREVFIDGSGPVVYGHSSAGGLDTDYVLLAEVSRHVQPNGRTEQRSDTWFQSSRVADGHGGHSGNWRLRMGAGEPTRFAVLFDRGLRRFSAVCERYYAPAVQTLLGGAPPRSRFDPGRALQLMPLRLSAPDAFVPGMGWTMDEYPDAAYPFAHDSCVQTGNLLAYEGLATGRAWERGFGKWVLDRSPIVGAAGTAFNVRRPGGTTRWGYTTDYKHPFPRMDGGSWSDAQALYTTALITGDRALRKVALDMMRHDIGVKLDLKRMTFPPCWDCAANRPGDHRDDWAITTLLAYCAEVSSQILYPETHDHAYLEKADAICLWFRSRLEGEQRTNYLNDGVNMYNAWSGWIPAALVHAYERTGDRAYLDIAKDVAWVSILTLGVTRDSDPGGTSFTGVTCVGVRGCVDYDCAPNLCQEKDLVFDMALGPLLRHVSGPAYAQYLALQRLALPRDSWTDAFAVQELRGTNLRTMYDTWARGTANLAFALDRTNRPDIVVVERRVLERATDVDHAREIVLANPTDVDHEAELQVLCLSPGTYRVRAGSSQPISKTAARLSEGISVRVPAHSTRTVSVSALSLDSSRSRTRAYDRSITYLSSLTDAGAQRGVGLPTPVYRKDVAFDGGPMALDGRAFAHGLGCAANTVIVYRLDGRYRRFEAAVGVDSAVASAADPPASVDFTVFVDGECRFDSGAMTGRTKSKMVDVDMTGARTLVLRVSGNWDDGGRTEHDRGDWADARLVGREVTFRQP